MAKKNASKAKSAKSAKDIYAMRKRKKRRKVLRQSAWMLLLAVLILVLYQRRDSWMPKLETIGMRHENHRQGGYGATEGEFPLYVNGSNGYQMGAAGENLIVLNDSYLQVYETDGNLLSVRQHTYGSAMLQTAGEYALVYEYGGTRFRLETAQKTHFEKTTADPIIFCRLSPNGLIAAVTSSETCACKLFVFNQKGQQIYERECVERLTDLTFHTDDAGCYAVTLEAADGGLQSVVHSYSFTQKTDLWTSEPLDMLAISVYNTIDGFAFVLGDTCSVFFDPLGKVKSTYVYPDELKYGYFADDLAVLLLSNDEKRTKSLVLLDGSAEAPVIQPYDREVKAVGVAKESRSVLVQLRNQFEIRSSSGELTDTLSVPDGYNGFLQIGNDLFLRGYDRIDKMELEYGQTE